VTELTIDTYLDIVASHEVSVGQDTADKGGRLKSPWRHVIEEYSRRKADNGGR
jgi:hypothetical protein